ncbi:MAG: hypothetical protein VX700_13125, partial [Pseudomonadota bacterium]|nr:hypothetical protein [Pseudomonadota bacterium]
PYVFWYLLNRMKRGTGIILARSRLIDQGMHELFLRRFSAIEETPNLLDRILGRSADALVHYHDQQPLYIKSLGKFGMTATLPRLRMGAPNDLPTWRALIDHECEVEKSKLVQDGRSVSEVYAFFATKLFSSTELRSPDSVEETTRRILTILSRLRPNATILLRPHPLAANEAYLQDILEELNNPQIVVTFAHPEILLRLARRTIVNAPTNILFTSGEGRFIDCSDYRERDIDARHGEGFAAGYATLYLNPNTSDFDDRFADALETDYWAGNPYIASARNRLRDDNPLQFEGFMNLLNSGSTANSLTPPFSKEHF